MKRSLLVFACLMLGACAEREEGAPVYDTAGVERRTIEVAVSSAGIVEPIATVEVKSKASGEVLGVFVATGDTVEEGSLMVSIDPRIVRNRLAQSEAELKAARSRREIALTQKRRVDSLVTNGTLTQSDLEQATLDLANAEAQVVTAEVAVENARIAVDDTDIRAPISGSILFKPVEVGQVISSPTQDFAGGTLLMQMADLSAVQIRTLVDETDIGKIRPGMPASVSVAAYPNQPFPGEVMKIEPQAVIEQNVTMFAVLVSIQNPDGLLMPGMNAEVEMSVARADDAMTIPVMALRTRRDLESTATVLGRPVEDITRALAADSDVPKDSDAPETITIRGSTIELPEGVSAEQVRELMQKRRDGGTLSAEEQKLLRGVFQGMSRGGGSRPQSDYRFGGEFWVVLDTPDREIRKVRTGVTDLDNVEIISGLGAEDRVLILPSSHLLETQQDLQNFINRRVRGVPGIG
ncbi:MAG: efflux RND transporter periplasmic adaptor subunit [Gammaproteobacteria bacterium]|nr:efflux RND transporter periplasmic adaptor subunit [Gammaproteobacteria bacterium]